MDSWPNTPSYTDSGPIPKQDLGASYTLEHACAGLMSYVRGHGLPDSHDWF